MSSWSSQYVGIPYLENGYDRRGCSCWGLVRLVLIEQFGVILPRHDQADIYDVDNFVTGYDPVALEKVQPGHVFHCWGIDSSGHRSPTHAGIAVGGGKMLHTEAGTGAIVERIASKRAAWRIIGAYRPRINAE